MKWLAASLTPRRCCTSGRHVGYPVALEGALKLKEIAYMHAEGFAAGELKHGPIALIEEGIPVIVTVPSPKSRPILHAKMLSNIREIQARGARTIIIAEEFDDTVAPFADYLDRAAPGPEPVPAVGGDDPDADHCRRDREMPGIRHRQAPKSGKVRHGGVTADRRSGTLLRSVA